LAVSLGRRFRVMSETRRDKGRRRADDDDDDGFHRRSRVATRILARTERRLTTCRVKGHAAGASAMKKCLAVARNREVVVTCAGHVRLLNTRDVPSRRGAGNVSARSFARSAR